MRQVDEIVVLARVDVARVVRAWEQCYLERGVLSPLDEPPDCVVLGEHAEPHEAVGRKSAALPAPGEATVQDSVPKNVPVSPPLTVLPLPGVPFAQAAGLGPAVVVNVPVTIFTTVNEPLAFGSTR